MNIYIVIGFALSFLASVSYALWLHTKNAKILATLQMKEAELIMKSSELKQKENEFALKESEFLKKEHAQTRTITALETIVVTQDRILAEYREED